MAPLAAEVSDRVVSNSKNRAEEATRKRARGVHDAARVATLHILYTPVAGVAGGSVRVSDVVRIGRVLDVEVCLRADPQVSRVHATLVPTADRSVEILDSSTNGTFVNGERVHEAKLRDGDVLRVGDSLLLLRQSPESDMPGPPIPGLKGEGPGMAELRRTIDRVAPTDATVLIIGETGTGKEVVARAVYALSGSAGPFVAVNCAAIPGDLAESQIFGHVAGAFTGALREHDGYVRAANGGVLFLDEIGELARELQGKLLRFLDERTAFPVGSIRSFRSNVRVIAATNRELREAVHAGQFRGDLFARLAEITIRTVPLRARCEDILPALLGALAIEAPSLSPELAEALVLYDWPFNVREILKVAKELGIRGEAGKALGLGLVRDRLRRFDPARGRAATLPPAPQTKPNPPSLLPIPTRDELLRLLQQHRGVIASVARATGRSRRQVQRWIEKWDIDVSTFSTAPPRIEDR